MIFKKIWVSLHRDTLFFVDTFVCGPKAKYVIHEVMPSIPNVWNRQARSYVTQVLFSSGKQSLDAAVSRSKICFEKSLHLTVGQEIPPSTFLVKEDRLTFMSFKYRLYVAVGHSHNLKTLSWMRLPLPNWFRFPPHVNCRPCPNSRSEAAYLQEKAVW